MSILRFRVIFEEYDDVHRDIDLKDDHTFADLFAILLQSIQFDNKHRGTFFLADHNWRKGEMIGEIEGNTESKLAKTELISFIDDPHQKFLLSYGPDASWNFTIELIRLIGSAENRQDYPRVASSVGIAPVQYKESLIIPVRERLEPDGRGRKKKIVPDNESLFEPADIDDDEYTESEGGPIEDSAPEEISMELPADLDLETDTEIAKLAEEFNNTTEIDESESGQDEEDEYGYSNDDDEYGQNDDDDPYGDRYGSRSDYDD